jgi:hypothetical protein
VVGGGDGGAQRALLVQGRVGRTSIVTHYHRDNNDAVNNVGALTTTTTPLLVAMALSAAQNNNQQTKGENKRRDGDDRHWGMTTDVGGEEQDKSSGDPMSANGNIANAGDRAGGG